MVPNMHIILLGSTTQKALLIRKDGSLQKVLVQVPCKFGGGQATPSHAILASLSSTSCTRRHAVLLLEALYNRMIERLHGDSWGSIGVRLPDSE